jgi:hypothetical protein
MRAPTADSLLEQPDVKDATFVHSASTNLEYWIVATSWLVAALLGAVHAWADRFTMGSDGLSYLEIGEAYLRGDWGAAINGYWSPLYSWLLGLTLLILRPTPYWEFPAVHLVNFGIYLCALGCFHFFLRQLIAYHRTRTLESQISSLPAWAWWTLGYSLFIWSSLTKIPLSLVTPDQCVAAFVLLAAGILLRIRGGSVSWVTFALLGLVLGFGYLAKAPMFPLAFVFIGVGVLAVGTLRRGMALGAVSLASFLLISGPFIVALSITKGRLTFSDTAKLNYIFRMNRPPPRHWQGTWPPGIGKPEHPTRKIFDQPAVYEFASPVAGTYPPWYDPSYWNEGMSPNVDLRKQLKIIISNFRHYFRGFLTFRSGVIAGFIILPLLLAGALGLIRIRDFAQQSTLLLPALAGLGMYSLVSMDGRYTAPFSVLFWLGIISAVRLPESQVAGTLVRGIILFVAASIMTTLVVFTGPKAKTAAYELLNRVDHSAHIHWQVAEDLKKMGVRPGDQVGIIGQGTYKFYAHWARLARVKIVAEIISRDVDEFEAADEAKRFRVMEAFGKAGARVVVADDLPASVFADGWRKVRDTNYFAYLLPQS